MPKIPGKKKSKLTKKKKRIAGAEKESYTNKKNARYDYHREVEKSDLSEDDKKLLKDLEWYEEVKKKDGNKLWDARGEYTRAKNAVEENIKAGKKKKPGKKKK